MHIENMKTIQETLASKIKAEFENGIECIDTEEMGAAVDMLKDISNAIYHAVVTQAMEDYDYDEDTERRFYDEYRYKNGRFAPKGRGTRRGYEEPPYYHMTPEQYREWEKNRDMDRATEHKMYFSEPIMRNGAKNHVDTVKESRYDTKKRAYTESKELHKANTPEDKQAKMKDLENYMSELSADMTELIKDMSAEEKTLLKNKLTVLATKV